jgi:hypothetical protein
MGAPPLFLPNLLVNLLTRIRHDWNFDMVKSFTLFILFFSGTAIAGAWDEIDRKTLKFSGHIENGDLERLEAVLTPEVKVLYVDSTGGDAEVALHIALKLLANQLTVIVDGFCASSCANYLFTVGVKKEIHKGWVGFHGNMTAMLATDWDKNSKRMREEYNILSS